MFDVLHQIIDKVHGWRSEEDRVNAHAAVTEYQQSQEGDAVPADDTTDADAPDGRHESTDLFTSPGDESSK